MLSIQNLEFYMFINLIINKGLIILKCLILREGLKQQNLVNQKTYKVFSRGGRIRTCGLHVPNVAR